MKGKYWRQLFDGYILPKIPDSLGTPFRAARGALVFSPPGPILRMITTEGSAFSQNACRARAEIRALCGAPTCAGEDLLHWRANFTFPLDYGEGDADIARSIATLLSERGVWEEFDRIRTPADYVDKFEDLAQHRPEDLAYSAVVAGRVDDAHRWLTDALRRIRHHITESREARSQHARVTEWEIDEESRMATIIAALDTGGRNAALDIIDVWARNNAEALQIPTDGWLPTPR